MQKQICCPDPQQQLLVVPIWLGAPREPCWELGFICLPAGYFSSTPAQGWLETTLAQTLQIPTQARVEPPHLQPPDPAPFSPISPTPLTPQQKGNLQSNTEDKPQAGFLLCIPESCAEKPERLGQQGQCWQQQPAGTQRCQQGWKNSRTALALEEERAALINPVFPPQQLTQLPALSGHGD